MIIKFFIEHACSNNKLIVDVGVQDHIGTTLTSRQINLQNKHNLVDLLFEFPAVEFKDLTVHFCTVNLGIVHTPVTITNIELDNFYSSPSITYSACREFSAEFLLYAGRKNIHLDLSTTEDNCLNFTGKLTYKFKWPFYRNIIHEK